MLQALHRLVLLLIGLSLSLTALASPPQTLDYQGYLASSSGVPLTGSVNVSISLYTAASGGAALWTQAGSPTLSNGRFAVVLDGSGGNAFPAAVFNQPLFVGLTVDTDPEMTPRQPLTSVPSAFEAMNADTLGGLHSNEIIDAASDEVRTPISSLPFTISASGSYYLTQNLTATTGGIDVNVDNVTIDLMGFTLDGNGVNDYGIYLNGRSVVVIKDGAIREFGRAGVFNGAGGSANVVSDVQVIANGSLGSSAGYSGIYLGSSSNRVERCMAQGNGGSGIYSHTYSIVSNNISFDNGEHGIYGQNGSRLTSNIAYNNQGAYGIYGGSYTRLANNSAYNNQGTYGIRAGAGSTLVDNTAYNNQGWGIYANDTSIVTGNSLYFNNVSQAAIVGGLRIGSDSQVVNNTADSNYEAGIHVSGTDNVLRNNHATDSILVGGVSRCIHFVFNDNAVIGNTATGCTTEFSGSYPTTIDRDNDAW